MLAGDASARRFSCTKPTSLQSCSRRKSRGRRHYCSTRPVRLALSLDETNPHDNDFLEEPDEETFLKQELSHLESLEQLLSELDTDNDALEQEEEDYFLDEETWSDLFESATLDEDDLLAELQHMGDLQQDESITSEDSVAKNNNVLPTESLESALLQGVVPADAGVGSGSLPGDWGFDPLNLASKDIIGKVQRWIWNQLPSDDKQKYNVNENRPLALVLRDYREAEIRHGRLAMLACVIWPFQEMLDRLLLEDYQFGATTIVYGGVTLPYFSLLMTAILLLLGYLDIYANAIKNVDAVGEAFLPGDCFWDPLKMLEGAPSRMKRNMQERELFNGRMAMLAFAVFWFEEATTHTPLIVIPGNELLFEPAYQVPYIQEWLDSIFASTASSNSLEDAVNQVLQEEASTL